MRPKPHLRRAFGLFLRHVIPHGRWGDWLHDTLLHLAIHKRLPTDPTLYSDHLWRLKTSGELYDPLRQFISDKELVKLYIRAVIGEAHNIPTYAVLRRPEEVDGFDFPPDCVIKPTHGSGQVILRRAGSEIDRAAIKGYFNIDLYYKGRQRNYRHLTPKVIVEALAFGRADHSDYRVFCQDGAPRLILVVSNVGQDRRQTLFDLDWTRHGFRINRPAHDDEIPRPACLEAMLEAAAKLSAPLPSLRVDFYTDGTEFLVGELTNCHNSGAARFRSRADERAFSEALFGPAGPGA